MSHASLSQARLSLRPSLLSFFCAAGKSAVEGGMQAFVMWMEVGWERVSVWVSGQGAWMLKAPCTSSLRPYTLVAQGLIHW